MMFVFFLLTYCFQLLYISHCREKLRRRHSSHRTGDKSELPNSLPAIAKHLNKKIVNNFCIKFEFIGFILINLSVLKLLLNR